MIFIKTSGQPFIYNVLYFWNLELCSQVSDYHGVDNQLLLIGSNAVASADGIFYRLSLPLTSSFLPCSCKAFNSYNFSEALRWPRLTSSTAWKRTKDDLT